MPKQATKSFLCKLCERRVRIPDGWTRGPAVRSHYWSKPRSHDAGEAFMTEPRNPDMGDLIVVLLASTLAGLRDRLLSDGYGDAAELVGDLVEMVDDYVTHVAA